MASQVPKKSGFLIAVGAVGLLVGAGVLYLAGSTVFGAMSYRSDVEEARAEHARDATERVAAAVEAYRARLRECPTIGEDLVREELLSETPLDPWGRNLVIDCAADHISVVSPGPDGRFATDDDVRARR